MLQIATSLNSSKHHVAKVMQRLVKDGFLNSHRGPTGGFTMKKRAKDISLLEIYESIEGKIEIGNCPLDHSVCKFGKCLFNNVTMKMTQDFVAYMRKEKLSDFI